MGGFRRPLLREAIRVSTDESISSVSLNFILSKRKEKGGEWLLGPTLSSAALVKCHPLLMGWSHLQSSSPLRLNLNLGLGASSVAHQGSLPPCSSSCCTTTNGAVTGHFLSAPNLHPLPPLACTVRLSARLLSAWMMRRMGEGSLFLRRLGMLVDTPISC